MDSGSDELQEEAVELLQELGLREYEAKSFVGLSRLPQATAKEISEITDVPRTRVYDSIRVLEAKGLVEIQHSNPRQFRAVPIDEAIDSIENEYESRVATLRRSLEGIEPLDRDDEQLGQEIWALTGSESVANRTQRLFGEAGDEVVVVVGWDELLSEPFLDSLAEASGRSNVVVGTVTETMAERVRESVPRAKVFLSGLEWLHDDGDDGTAIGRLVLVDRETILVSTVDPETGKEQAIFGRGFGNGLVVIARRLMSTGLIPAEDPDPP